MPGSFSILIADDNDDDVAFVLQGFADISVAVTPTRARDGEACLNLLLDHDAFRIVVIDFYLPKKNGPEVIELLRSRRNFVSPIVVLTSHIVESERRRLQEIGVRAIFEKPGDLAGFAKLAKCLFALAEA